MTVGSTVVVTPVDNPCQFDPDWRASVAQAFVDNPSERVDPEYLRYRSDKYVRLQMQFLRNQRSGSRNTGSLLPVRIANLWAQGTSVSDTRFRLDPLLLTPVSYDVIALDITGDGADRDAVEAYEKLFFNIRDPEGRLNKSCQLRQWFAMPDGIVDNNTPPEAMWKVVGALMGYDTLVGMWLWKDAHGIENSSQEYMLDEMWRVAQSRLFMSMFADRVGHESMAKLLASVGQQQKMLRESRDSGDISTDVVVTLMKVLSLTAPKVIDATASDVDRQNKVMMAVAARLEAEKEVYNTDIGNMGANGVPLLPSSETVASGAMFDEGGEQAEQATAGKTPGR